MEYVAAKSTMCRQCGRSFSPSAPKPELKLRPKENVSSPAEVAAPKRFEGLWSRPRSRSVACFECKRKHEVSDDATSINCHGCSAHLDIRDYNIPANASLTIRHRRH